MILPERTFGDVVDVLQRILSRGEWEEGSEVHVLGELLEVLQLGLYLDISLSDLLSASALEECVSVGGFIQNVARLTRSKRNGGQ